MQVKQEAASLEEELATARAEHDEERAEQQKRAAEVTAALEAERDRLQHEQAESLARFTQERQQAREALETARAHILQLNAANEEATQQAASAQAAAAAAAARCAAAEAEATKTREKLREMMAHAAERVQAGILKRTVWRATPPKLKGVGERIRPVAGPINWIEESDLFQK